MTNRTPPPPALRCHAEVKTQYGPDRCLRRAVARVDNLGYCTVHTRMIRPACVICAGHYIPAADLARRPTKTCGGCGRPFCKLHVTGYGVEPPLMPFCSKCRRGEPMTTTTDDNTEGTAR